MSVGSDLVQTKSKAHSVGLAFGNFRDYGGYPSRFGGHVQRDRLYRSGHLAGGTADDVERLLQMDFKLIADLRYGHERKDQPSPWPGHYDDRLLMHEGTDTSDAPHVAVMRSGAFDEAAVYRFYVHYYSEMATEQGYQLLFAKFLQTLCVTQGRSLIHCSAGKDRTGLLAALVNHILGVDEETILADFMLSRNGAWIDAMVPEIERRLREKIGRAIPHHVVVKMLDVEEDYLKAAFTSIKSKWNSIDAFLEFLGVGASRQAALRQQLLVPV